MNEAELLKAQQLYVKADDRQEYTFVPMSLEFFNYFIDQLVAEEVGKYLSIVIQQFDNINTVSSNDYQAYYIRALTYIAKLKAELTLGGAQTGDLYDVESLVKAAELQKLQSGEQGEDSPQQGNGI